MYAKLLELLRGGLGQLRYQCALASSLRDLDGHRATALLAQPTRKQVRLLDCPRKDHGSRHVRRAGVVLEDEAAQQLGLGHLGGAVERMPVVADHLALPAIRDFAEHLRSMPGLSDAFVVVATRSLTVRAVG